MPQTGGSCKLAGDHFWCIRSARRAVRQGGAPVPFILFPGFAFLNPAPALFTAAMAERQPGSGRPAAKSKDARQKRLSASLRANLRRRKEQARSRMNKDRQENPLDSEMPGGDGAS